MVNDKLRVGQSRPCDGVENELKVRTPKALYVLAPTGCPLGDRVRIFVRGEVRMLAGLYGLTKSEVDAFARETETYVEGATKESLLDGLLNWTASRVGCKAQDPQEIEQAALVWLSQRLDLTFPENASVDDMEAAVRRKIAEESFEFLFPFLELGSAVAYIWPRQVVGPKLELLEAASAALIPSHSARDRMRKYWQERGTVLLRMEAQLTPAILLEYLKEPLERLAQSSLQTRLSVLILNHVVALSDGRFEAPEEHFIASMGQTLGVSNQDADRVRKEVSENFWNQLTALGGGTYQSRDTEEELTVNMRAAQLTLEATGGLASFTQEVEQGFVSSLHRSLENDSAFRRGFKQGGATPMRFPLGFATGMLCYIKERWNVQGHEILMRLCLAAIFRQHLVATGDHAKITAERIEGYLPERKVENVAETLGETAVGKGRPPVSRRISLEPSTFQEGH